MTITQEQIAAAVKWLRNTVIVETIDLEKLADMLEAISEQISENEYALIKYDNGDTVSLSSYSGGAAPEGIMGTITLIKEDAEGNATFREYRAVSDWRSGPKAFDRAELVAERAKSDGICGNGHECPEGPQGVCCGEPEERANLAGVRVKPFIPFSGQSFATKREWIHLGKYVLTAHPEYLNTEHDGPSKGWRGNHFTALCYDQKGRRVRNGGDFQRAEDDNAFPVWWVWPDQIPELVMQQDKT